MSSMIEILKEEETEMFLPHLAYLLPPTLRLPVCASATTSDSPCYPVAVSVGAPSPSPPTLSRAVTSVAGAEVIVIGCRVPKKEGAINVGV
jgi:hypothetical protein